MSTILHPPELDDAAGFDPYYKWLAINPKEQPPNYYRLLGVSLFESDPDVIANAADARMAHVKTFQTGAHSALSQRILNEIALAKVCLLNPQQRSEYDWQLRGRLDAGKPELLPCAPTPPAVAVPTSIRSLPRRKKPLDAVFGLSLLGVTAVALAVSLLVYWGRTHNDDASFAPRSTIADRPVSKPGKQKPRPEVKLRVPKPSVPRVRASKKPRAVAQQNTRQPKVAKVQPLAEEPVPDSDKPDSKRDSGLASRKLAEKNPADAPAMDLADLVEKVKPSIVQIETEDGLGSGFVVDESGSIVTNYHVIHGAKRAMAKFSNGLSVEIVGYVAVDEGQDLVILCTKTKEKLKALPIRSDLPRQAEKVIAIGSPRGLEFTVSEGIVSAIRTDFQPKVQGRGYDPGITWIQTTAAISPGNSGGPLVTMDGKVVGVNTIINIERGSQNLNFAIHAGAITKLMRNMADKPSPLASLPGLRRRPRRPDEDLDKGGPRINITFPSGANLTEAMLEVPRGWEKKIFLKKTKTSIVYIATYPNDKIRGAFYLDEAKLDGMAIAIYESGYYQTSAFYKSGNRDGPMKQWNEDGDRLLYADYKYGRKHGLLCLFQANSPWLIQEWDKENVQNEYLVKSSELVPKPQMNAEESEEYRKAIMELAFLEAKLKASEDELKRDSADWYRQVKMRIAREIQTEEASDKLRRQLDGISKRNRARAAGFEEKRRRIDSRNW